MRLSVLFLVASAIYLARRHGRELAALRAANAVLRAERDVAREQLKRRYAVVGFVPGRASQWEIN